MPLAYIDVIIFGIIAVFLFLKLRNTIGTRHGEERKRPTLFDAPKPEEKRPEKLGEKLGEKRDEKTIVLDTPSSPHQSQPKGIVESAVLTQIALKDPSFDERDFIQGAKFAFETIVEAFAKGDKETLDSLLSPQMMDSFEKVIDRNKEKGYVVFTDILNVKKAEIQDCKLDESIANITIKFTADEIRTVKNNAGDLLSGDPDQIHEIKDIWTFQKNLKSSNPNWTLVKTQSEQ